MSRLRGRYLLVTGADGFLGSKMVSRLASEGAEVYAAHRSQTGRDLTRERRHILQDLTEPLRYEDFPRRLDGIIHCAACTDPETDTSVILGTNVVGTARLLAYARDVGAKTFTYLSTGGIYGYQQQPINEDTTPHPLNLYANSKYQAELLVRGYNRYFTTVILRLFFPYGSGQVGRLVPTLIEKIRTGVPITVYNSGETPFLNPVYVDDVVEVIVRAMSYGKTCVLNVGGGDRLSVMELAIRAGRLLGQAPVFTHLVDESIGNMVADISALRSALAFVPSVSIQDGLRRVIGPH